MKGRKKQEVIRTKEKSKQEATEHDVQCIDK
jgi:hypothetical protein